MIREGRNVDAAGFAGRLHAARDFDRIAPDVVGGLELSHDAGDDRPGMNPGAHVRRDERQGLPGPLDVE